MDSRRDQIRRQVVAVVNQDHGGEMAGVELLVQKPQGVETGWPWEDEVMCTNRISVDQGGHHALNHTRRELLARRRGARQVEHDLGAMRGEVAAPRALPITWVSDHHQRRSHRHAVGFADLRHVLADYGQRANL